MFQMGLLCVVYCRYLLPDGKCRYLHPFGRDERLAKTVSLSAKDAPYQVSDAVRQQVDASPQPLTFKQLAGFLDLKQEWIESLTEQRPPLILWKNITAAQVAKFVYRLKTDSKGWQSLQTLNLPTQLPAPKKRR
ncbi:MAG: hypothetical protein NZT92_06925 [Abditibacteriales bacterium]|nr:hypothetical protein [Abditibacteriales bacterium]MDW8364733.1 hypothetical protein [Abditibacteriales bacterium]